MPLVRMKGTDIHSRIEALEGRIAPASLVTVTLTGGALELTGDNGAHDFSIRALDSATVQLSAAVGTLFHMTGVADTETLLLSTPIKSLSVTLDAGQDTLHLSGLSMSGDIKIDLGDGSNILTLDSVDTTKGSLDIKGGTGTDTISFAGAVNSVKKDVHLLLGDGDNSFTQASTLLQVGGQFSYTGGANGDAIGLSSGVVVKGNTDIVFGAGANVFTAPTFLNITFGKNLTFDSSASTSAVGDTTNIQFSAFTAGVIGSLRIVDGDGALAVGQAAFGFASSVGSISVVTGGGTSAINLGNAQFGAKSLMIDASASSSSSLAIGGFVGSFGTAPGSKVKYIGGAGPDALTVQILGGNLGRGASLFSADLGDGDNNVQIVSYAGFFKNVQLKGGTGVDHFQFAIFDGTMGNIDIDNGSGPAQTVFQLLNAKVTGQIKVTNGTDPGASSLALGLVNSQIGSLSYTSEAATNAIDFGAPFGPGASNNFSVKKSIQVVTGSGSDMVHFGSAANVKIGKIDLALGDGTNVVDGSAIGNFTTKALTVTGGAGVDNVNFSGSGNLGAVKLTLGAGANSALFLGAPVPLTLSSLTFSSTSATTETDSLTLARIQVLGKLNATFGADASAFTINDSVIGGPFFADTGAGPDMVSIDTVDSFGGTFLVKPGSILLGDGDDTLSLGGNGSSALVTTKSTFKADGGSGTNTLTNDSNNVFAKDPVFVNLP